MTSEYKKYIRSIIFLISGLTVAIFLKAVFSIALLLLAIFYYAVDVHNIDKRSDDNSEIEENFESYEIGVFGKFIVDGTEDYGIFIILDRAKVFITIRDDKFFKERKTHAHYLFNNSSLIEESLKKYISMNPEFSNRKISYIGLHSKNLEQGEVFWKPEGYTILEGLKFI